MDTIKENNMKRGRIMKKTRNKKVLSILVSFLMLLNIFASTMPVFAAGTPDTIAAWNFTSAPTTATIAATDGIFKAGATLTNQMGKTPSYTASNSTIYTSGWDNGAGTKYWQFSLSTKGYSSLTFTANAYSTSYGPRDFKIIYSADNGNNWNDVGSSDRVLTTALPGTPTWNGIALPAGAGNQDNLLIRLIMTSNTPAGGTGSINASNGNSRLAAISITGTVGTGSGLEKVKDVVATPNGGAVVNGSTFSLFSPTNNSTVHYDIYSPDTTLINSGTYSNFIKLNFDAAATPITVKAYATADGMDNSNTSTWVFTQAKQPKVTANPAGGELGVGANIALSAATDAAIYYTTDGSIPDTSSTAYTGVIAIQALPCTIKAIAVKAGYVNSDVAIFTYTAESPQNYTLDGETGTAAEWILSSPGTNVNFTQPIQATGGDYKNSSGLSCFFGATSQTLNFSSGGASCGNWSGGSTKPNYWQVSTSTKGMANLNLSWRMRSTGTAPRDFKVQYSIDGSYWTDVAKSNITVPNAAAITADNSLFNVALPSSVSNKDTVFLRWIMTSEYSANGSASIGTGTNQINNISLTGAYTIGDNQVYAVKGDVPSGPVVQGSTLTLSSQTSGASIKYSIDGGTSYNTAENGKITLNTLPIALYVKAVKAGMDDSRIKTFSYTQAKTANVIPSPAGGEVQLNDEVKLKCATQGAAIYYSLVQNPGPSDFIQYNQNTPIKMAALPADLTVYATAPGCIDDRYLHITIHKH